MEYEDEANEDLETDNGTVINDLTNEDEIVQEEVIP